jgi:hypothetical protein
LNDASSRILANILEGNMYVTATELQNNLGKYLELCKRNNIIITQNGKKRALPRLYASAYSGRIIQSIQRIFQRNKSCAPYFAPFDVDLSRQPIKEEREVTEDNINVAQPDLLVVCDPENNSVTVYSFQAYDLHLDAVYNSGQTAESVIYPGLRVTLENLFIGYPIYPQEQTPIDYS